MRKRSPLKSNRKLVVWLGPNLGQAVTAVHLDRYQGKTGGAVQTYQ